MAPKLVLSAMFFVSVFRLHELFPSVSAAIHPGILAGPVAFVFMLVTFGSNALSLRSNRAIIWIIAFSIWAAITVPFALYRGLAFESVQVLIPSILLVLSITSFPTTKASLDLLSAIFVSGGGLLGLAAILVGDGSSGRLSVTSTLDPNDLGAIMAITLPFAMGCISTRKGPFRVWAILVALIALIVVTKTGSRGSTLGMVAGATIFAAASAKKLRMYWTFMLLCGGVAGWFLAPPNFRERMTTLTSIDSDYNTTEYGGRKEIWLRGLSYAVANPILGVGIGNFPVAEGDRLAELGSTGKWSAAHNAYVQVLAETGFIGFAIFLAMLIESVRSSIRWSAFAKMKILAPERQRPELIASMVAMLVSAMFLSLAYSWVLYALLGVAGHFQKTFMSENAGSSH